MKTPQLTLNDSNIFKVLYNTKTGKFLRMKYEEGGFSWTDQIRLCWTWSESYSEQDILSTIKVYNNLIQGPELVVKTFQLQYVEL
jgi:hypothetical protein